MFEYLNWFTFSFSKSREKRLITKECIATYAHLNFAAKQAFNVCILIMKLFSSAAKLF